ncbi:MAG: hypothetical protein LBJ67_02720 [Planctomycetaceae bacterium]|jgi:hypothetical protein|nr:hypothetical protein [Planctomycetaceae bacterium]
MKNTVLFTQYVAIRFQALMVLSLSLFMVQLSASDDPATLNREGQVVVKANDLEIVTPLSTWSNQRTYESGAAVGQTGYEIFAPLGYRWQTSVWNMTLQKNDDNIELHTTGAQKRVFTATTDNSYTPPTNCSAELEKIVVGENEEELFVLTYPESGYRQEVCFNYTIRGY